MITAAFFIVLFAYGLLVESWRWEILCWCGGGVIMCCLTAMGVCLSSDEVKEEVKIETIINVVDLDEEMGDVANNDTYSLSTPLLTTTTPAEKKKENSRSAATRRLLQLAKPEKALLYLGCLVLLIRLPFSLSIPHFVASSLGHLGNAEWTNARSDMILLFVCGT